MFKKYHTQIRWMLIVLTGFGQLISLIAIKDDHEYGLFFWTFILSSLLVFTTDSTRRAVKDVAISLSGIPIYLTGLLTFIFVFATYRNPELFPGNLVPFLKVNLAIPLLMAIAMTPIFLSALLVKRTYQMTRVYLMRIK